MTALSLYTPVPELLSLPDGRPVTVTNVHGQMTAMLYDEPLAERTTVIAVDGDPAVRLSNLHRLQDVFRNATTWSRTQYVGSRISYINNATDEEFQWLIEEVTEKGLVGVDPTTPFRQLSPFVRSEVGFQERPADVVAKDCTACGRPLDSLDDTIVFYSAPIHGRCGETMASQFDEAWNHADDLLGNSL